MFSDRQISTLLARLRVTHVVTVPDSTIGRWEPAIAGTEGVRLVRVCREGEAWAVAAGLFLGGRRPLVMIQCTGLFESGDALRNALHDWKLPIPSVIGYRSFLNQDLLPGDTCLVFTERVLEARRIDYRSFLNQDLLPGDTCLVFTERVLEAWRIDYRLITEPGQFEQMAQYLEGSLAAGRRGPALIAEGRT